MTKLSKTIDAYQEGTSEYERLHVDPKELKCALDIMKRIHGKKGFFGPQFDWYQKACPSYNIPLSHDPGQAEEDGRLVEQAKSTRDELKSAEHALHKITELVSFLREDCEQEIEAYRNRRILLSLPDEVLTMVLEYAAFRSDDEDPKQDVRQDAVSTVKAATKLSQVCRRFRRLVTHCASLWNYIDSVMKSEMVLACVSRSKKANLEVNLALSHHPRTVSSRIDPKEHSKFLDAILKRSDHWRSFLLTEEWNEFEAGAQIHLDATQMTYFASRTKRLKLPNLLSLTIEYPHFYLIPDVRHGGVLDTLHCYSNWSMPRLRSLSVDDIIPVPFPSSESLATLNIELHFNWLLFNHRDSPMDVNSLRSFLSVCSSLRELSLTVLSARTVVMPVYTGDPIQMHSLETLNLEFSVCRGMPLRAIFDNVRFPNTTAMTLKINSASPSRRDPADMTFNEIFPSIFRAPDFFPSLTDLRLRVIEDCPWIPRDLPIIPFWKMSKLKTLELETLKSSISPVPKDVKLPALRTLVLKNCHAVGTDWFFDVLKKFKAQGDLESLQVFLDGFCLETKGLRLEGQISKENIERLIE